LVDKYSFIKEMTDGKCDEYQMWYHDIQKTDIDTEQLKQRRVYIQKVEDAQYLFQYLEVEPGMDIRTVLKYDPFRDWLPMKHVYEFKKPKSETVSAMQSCGLIIGVRDGKLDEYVRLHDTQPQIIRDLCYQNGFRKSSIFETKLGNGHIYLLQYNEYLGTENPELYKNSVYQEWLRITGECQKPLPGEIFWKSMQEVYKYTEGT